MFVEWVQHPAGHGGFHTGRASSDGEASFNWIFDCGARGGRKFDDLLKSWIDRDERPVDWLFISHFDTDHVSGLETLFIGKTVIDVMVPYVNERELAYSLLYEIGRGNLTRSFVELVADPAEFFLSRGATGVTFLRGRRRPGPTEPVGRTRPDPFDGKLSGWSAKIDPDPSDLSEPTDALFPNWRGRRVRVVESEQCQITVWRGECGVILKPYRAPVPDAVFRGLTKALHKLLGRHRPVSGRPGLGRLAYAIAAHARTAAGRSNLQRIFKSFVGSSNRASMSLLSMPYVRPRDEGYVPDHYWQLEGTRKIRSFGENETPGWLNTGDAELLKPVDLHDWAAAYQPNLASVRVLSLPHHGSDNNSDAHLQAVCQDAVFVAHVKALAKKHPGSIVRGLAAGRLDCVTEAPDSTLRMLFRV